MAAKNIVVVFGATGKQGGSVVSSILGDPKASAQFAIRGVTRDATKPAAKALAEKGVEVATADMYDKDSLRAALKDAYALFLVTDFWARVDGLEEEKQGKNVADIAKELSIQHFIFSSLPNVTEVSKGKYDKVYHWDSKAHIEEYIRELGIPATFFNAGAYMNLFSPSFFFRPTATIPPIFEAAFHVPISAAIFPLFDAEADTGKFVKGILLHREEVLGKSILGTSGWWSLDQIVDEFKEVKPISGKGARAIEVSPETFKETLKAAHMPEITHDDMVQNLQWMNEFGYFNGGDETLSRAILDEPLTTWKQYVRKNASFAELN